MPDVSSAELVPKKKKKGCFCSKEGNPNHYCMSEQSSSLYNFYNPCVELYQTSAGDGPPPSALSVLEPIAVTVD